MLDFIREIFKSDAGSFGFVFAILMVVYYIIYYITKFTTKINTEHDTFSKRVNKMEENTDKIKENIIVIKGSVELIQRSLQNSNIIVNPYAQQRSPLRLTEDGGEMVKSVGIDRMIDENWTNIRSYMKKNLSTDNPYDIQQFLMEQTVAYPGKFINKDDLDRLKNIAYNKGYPLNVYLTVVALLIRDRYFSENNIDIEEIDKNDPQKVN
jgi:Na+-transporting methylmalonyl-CoA/oxaloacetate decarboxylase gamma subunit